MTSVELELGVLAELVLWLIVLELELGLLEELSELAELVLLLIVELEL